MTYKRQFLALWSASGTSYLAYWAMQLALTLFASRLTRSPLLVSSIGFALIAPALVLGLFAGAIVDRYDRRKLLIVNTALRMLTFGCAFLATLLGQMTLPWLIGIALVLGCTQALEEPALAASVPMLVARHQLERANSWLVGAQNVIEVLALPLSGFLASMSIAVTLGFAEGCAAAALLALILLRGNFQPSRTSKKPLITEVLTGLHFLWQQPALRTIGLMAGAINACWEAYITLLVLYMVTPGPGKLSATTYGVLLMCCGLGSVCGAMLAMPVQRWFGRRWAIGLNIFGNALMYLTPAFTSNAWILGVVLVIGGSTGPLWTIAAASLLGRSVPTELQGRVSSAYRFLGTGCAVLGPICGGLLAQFFGLHITFLICGCVTLLTLFPFFIVITEKAMAKA